VEASALRAPAGLTRIALPSALLRLRSDEQLVSLFRAGSDDAFGVIHDRYRARLFAYTRQMLGGSRSDAEDALQDVFLRAYNALRMDDRPVVLKAWLYRVAHNRCIDHLRRPVPLASEVFEVSRTPLPDPLAEAERRDDLRRLVADVQRLPEQQRSALLMRELEGLSYADLATALETTVPAVKSLLVRARIGLVEASEARNTACSDIRDDLALSFGKGVRASARSRKHLRECQGCRDYRRDLRGVQRGLTALTPAGNPFGLLAKLLGLGGASGGAAAGGSAAAGGGAAVVSGGVVAGTTAKVAAVVCCAAITAGGAVELKRATTSSGRDGAGAGSSASERARGGDRPGAGPTAIARQRTAPTAAEHHRSATRARAARTAAGAAATPVRRPAALAPLPAAEEPISPHVVDDTVVSPPPEPVTEVTDEPTGGVLAPGSSAGGAAPTSSSPTTTGTTGTTGTTTSPSAAPSTASPGGDAPPSEGTTTTSAQPRAAAPSSSPGGSSAPDASH
jgi:RNA polymerase sigma factor (sigma-70 family)